MSHCLGENTLRMLTFVVLVYFHSLQVNNIEIMFRRVIVGSLALQAYLALQEVLELQVLLDLREMQVKEVKL